MSNPIEPPAPSVSPASASATPASRRDEAPKRWVLVSLIAGGMLVGALFVSVLKSSEIASTNRAGAPVPAAPSTVTRSPAETVERARPKWSGGVRRSNGRSVAVYELEAENDVALWGKIVRPVLTVRCVAGTTEVFVLTQSAAAIDGTDGKHAVRIGYDGEPDGSERWLASDEYDALFAENGVRAARRIAGARAMRFGFMPYNASPVVARFDVSGFDALAPSLARTCRW